MVIQVQAEQSSTSSSIILGAGQRDGGVDGAGTAGPGLSPRRARDLPRGVMHLAGRHRSDLAGGLLPPWMLVCLGLSLAHQTSLDDSRAPRAECEAPAP